MTIYENPKEFVAAAANWAFRRVFLFANNPNIDPSFLSKFEITKEDCIVQFNDAAKFADLLYIECHKIFVFNLAEVKPGPFGLVEVKAGHLGFDDNCEFSRDYSAGKSVSLTYLFPYKISDPAMPALRALAESISVYCYDPGKFPIKFDLAAEKRPTVGYKVASLFKFLNEGLKRGGKSPMQVYWVGFDASLVNRSPDWVHNFSHEHDVISSWPDFIRIRADGTEVKPAV